MLHKEGPFSQTEKERLFCMLIAGGEWEERKGKYETVYVRIRNAGTNGNGQDVWEEIKTKKTGTGQAPDDLLIMLWTFFSFFEIHTWLENAPERHTSPCKFCTACNTVSSAVQKTSLCVCVHTSLHF